MTLTKCIEYWLNTLLSSLSKFLTDTYWLLLGKHTHLLVCKAILLKQSKVFIRLIYPTHSSVKKFFMPSPLGAGGIMFSGCPSVLPSAQILNYPLLTCTWVRWSIRPTVTILHYVRPSVCPSVHLSVRPERFPGICRRMHGGNDLKFYMLMYLDHLQNWLVYDRGLVFFFFILALFWLSETGQIWGFWAFPGERMEGMAWNFACWCISTAFRTDKFWVTVCWFF